MAIKKNQPAKSAHLSLGLDFSSALECALNTQIFILKGQFNDAKNTLSELWLLAQTNNSELLCVMHCFIEAWLILKQTNAKNATRYIKIAFKKAEQDKIYAYPGFMQSIIFDSALTLSKEQQKTHLNQSILQRMSFAPITPIENPWCLKITTFGQFSIEINGRIIDQTSRANRRSVELLQTIIALGGYQVSKNFLSQLMWPDSDGDKANHALESLIHRTRKLVGRNVLTINFGKVQLNKTLCWVDCWALKALNINTDMSKDECTITQLQLFSIYQGTFLSHCETRFSLVTREQYRRQFLTLVKQLSQKLQHISDELIITLWQQAIDREPYEESLYFELAQFYSKIGQYSEAKRIFQICEKILLATYGTSPSEAFKEFAKRKYL